MRQIKFFFDILIYIVYITLSLGASAIVLRYSLIVSSSILISKRVILIISEYVTPPFDANANCIAFLTIKLASRSNEVNILVMIVASPVDNTFKKKL